MERAGDIVAIGPFKDVAAARMLGRPCRHIIPATRHLDVDGPLLLPLQDRSDRRRNGATEPGTHDGRPRWRDGRGRRRARGRE